MVRVETCNTLADASSALGARSRYIGGGTLLMRRVNYGYQGFDHIVRTREDLTSISERDGRIRIGAGVTMAGIISARETEFLAPVARSVGGPAIRAMGTVGGNLFAPHPYGDFATALLALEARVELVGGGEEDIERFLAQRFEPHTAGRGLVAAVSVARPQPGSFSYLKVTRVKPRGASVLAIAAHLNLEGPRVSQARLAFGAMGDRPLRAKAAEAALRGATLDAAGIAPALAVASDGLEPPDDALASAWYRRQVAPVHLRRLLLLERQS